MNYGITVSHFQIAVSVISNKRCATSKVDIQIVYLSACLVLLLDRPNHALSTGKNSRLRSRMVWNNRCIWEDVLKRAGDVSALIRIGPIKASWEGKHCRIVNCAVAIFFPSIFFGA